MQFSFSFRTLYITGFLLLLTAGLWTTIIVPRFLVVPHDFTYVASIDSTDNFYNAVTKQFGGPEKTKTTFYYNVVSRANDVVLIRNVFDVRTGAGEPVFDVGRIYAIDSRTGMHVPGYANREREGFLFAPRRATQDPYVYWHANYDTPAHMKFVKEETIHGLTVYRYETDLTADQTENLDRLPGVPETRGISLDAHLTTWIEPTTGYLVNFKDEATAYFYDQKTKERIHPWNHFSNTYTEGSIAYHANVAKHMKWVLFLRDKLFPGILVVLGLMLFFAGFHRSRFFQFAPHASVVATEAERF